MTGLFLALRIVHLAWKNVRARRRSTMAMSALVAACFMALVLFRQYMADGLAIGHDTWAKRFMYGNVLIESPASAAERIRAPWAHTIGLPAQTWLNKYLKTNSLVKNVAPFLSGYGMLKGPGASAAAWIKAYDPAAGARLRGDAWRWDAATGKPLELGDGTTDILIGTRLAALIGCDAPRAPELGRFGYPAVYRPFTCPVGTYRLTATESSGRLATVDVHILGTISGGFDEIDDMLIAAPLAVAQRLYATTTIGFISVELQDPTAAAEFTAAFNREAALSGQTLTATVWQRHRDGDAFLRGEETLAMFRDFFDGLILVIAVLALHIALVRAYAGRIKEIAVLLIFGYRPVLLGATLTIEAFFHASLGSLLGLVLAAFTSCAINSFGWTYNLGGLTEPLPFRFGYFPAIYASASAFLILLVVVLAGVTAFPLVRRSPLQHLAAEHA